MQLKFVFKEDSLNPRTIEDFYYISRLEKEYLFNILLRRKESFPTKNEQVFEVVSIRRVCQKTH